MPDSHDPFGPPDPSQRPRPGAGRRGAPEAAFARSTLSQTVEPEPIPVSVRAVLGIGLNPLVQAASPLLLLIGQLRGTVSSLDVGSLRRHALDEVRRFEEQAGAAGVRTEIVLAARYALCAGLDEAVLSTPWGAHSEWAQHPLLIALHREAWGGEKFFEMLDRISVDPARHIDLMELQYLVLALGFTGKYQMLTRGHEQLADLQRDLFRRIRGVRGPAAADLSLQWRGLEDRRSRLIQYVPWWVVAAAAVAVLAVAFSVYYSSLATLADPLHTTLARVGVEVFDPPPPPPPRSGPTLKQLLAQEEAAGVLRVDENGGLSVVTLLASNLFGSGSAEVNPSHEATLGRIAAAVNQLTGTVRVVGHTDDQPIKSFRFRNNFDLSNARAETVANVLRRAMERPATVTWYGVGDTRPLYRPESDPENRARNRRVEIMHLSGE
jgi:type VI secretion system protein ImpK